MTFQYRANWSGTTGGPGVSVFNARLSGAALTTGPQQFADNVRALFAAIASNLPNEVSISFSPEVTELDTVTGQLIGVHPVTPPAAVPGNNASGYAMPVGVRIDWSTSSILNGGRLRGRTYFVPITADAFENNGSVIPAIISTFQTAGAAYIANMENIGSAAVWSRTHGILADIQEARVPDMATVLRSRRD